MTLSFDPATELGILWMHATLMVFIAWLFVRTRLMPVVVTTAAVYATSILTWMILVRFNVPAIWGIEIEGRTYPVITLTGLALLVAFTGLRNMKRRAIRKEAERRASLVGAPVLPASEAPSAARETV